MNDEWEIYVEHDQIAQYKTIGNLPCDITPHFNHNIFTTSAYVCSTGFISSTAFFKGSFIARSDLFSAIAWSSQARWYDFLASSSPNMLSGESRTVRIKVNPSSLAVTQSMANPYTIRRCVIDLGRHSGGATCWAAASQTACTWTIFE